jgi:hypothetical protein
VLVWRVFETAGGGSHGGVPTGKNALTEEAEIGREKAALKEMIELWMDTLQMRIPGASMILGKDIAFRV